MERGQEWGNDFKGRILRGRTDENDIPLLDVRQKGVLLRLC